jgi:hypothetical protein
MHPEVVSGAPGDCPICGMALERVDDRREDIAPAARKAVVDGVQRRVLGGQVRAPARVAGDGRVTALLHKDDLVGMAPGDHALFFAATSPATGVDVRLRAAPADPVDPSTCLAQFEMDARDRAGPLDAGETGVGLLQIGTRPRELLTVPASAVLYTTEGPYVLAATTDGGPFASRPVEIGRILDSAYASGVTGDSVGSIVVLSGLREGEQVVAADAFFWDAERRLRLARGQGEEVAR